MDDKQSQLEKSSTNSQSILQNSVQPAESSTTQPNTNQATKVSQNAKRILIVEDEKDYRDVLVEILQAEGFSVLQAEDGQQALDVMKNTDVDLILLDMLMPKMDGVTFLYYLRNTLNKKYIPIIILTNFTEAAYPEDVADYIIKSNTSLDDVIKKIRKIIPVSI